MGPGNIGRQKQYPPGLFAQSPFGLIGRALDQLLHAFRTDAIGFFAEPGHDNLDFTRFRGILTSTNVIKYHFVPHITRYGIFQISPGQTLLAGVFILWTATMAT
jgi:hypothetical protein